SARDRPAVRALLLLCLCSCASERAVEIEADGDAPPGFVSGELEARLEEADGRLRARGLSEETFAWRGFLIDGDADARELELQRGACHAFVAAVSSGISEIDLVLHDSEGIERARGSGTLRLCANESGVHFLSVRAAGSGLFSVRRYVGPTGLDVRLDDVLETP
ncbi:MAG: hypothetical protein AAF645_24560, partial [Myxococcota bacterium]